MLGRAQRAPTQVRTSPQSPPRDVILSERQRDEVLVVQQSGTDKTCTTCRDLQRNLRYPFNSKIYFCITWDFVRRKINFPFERGTPSPPAAELPPRKEPLKDYPWRVAVGFAMGGCLLGRAQRTPTSLCRSAPTQASLRQGGGEPASRRDCFKDKVTYPQTRVHGVPPYEFVRRARSFATLEDEGTSAIECKHSSAGWSVSIRVRQMSCCTLKLLWLINGRPNKTMDN